MSDIITTPVSASSEVSSPRQVEMAPIVPASPKVEQEATQADAPAPEAAPVEEPKLGKRFAELTRRQRELFEKEQSIKALEGKLNPVQQAIETAKQNPMKLLEAAGITYEELTEYILNGEEPTEASVSPVEKKVEELELKLKAKEEAEEQARQKAYEEQINAFRGEISKAAEAYELVHTLEQTDLVYDVILEHHSRTGNVLPIDQALQLTESYLEEQAKKVLSVSKFRANAPQVPEQKVGQSPKPAALSRAVVPPPSSNASASNGGKLTREQLLEQATSLLRFK